MEIVVGGRSMPDEVNLHDGIGYSVGLGKLSYYALLQYS